VVAFGRDATRWASQPSGRVRFEQMRPEVERHARCAFRDVDEGHFEEIVGRVVNLAFRVYLRLARRGMADIVYPKPLALSAIGQVRNTLSPPAEGPASHNHY